MIPAYNLPVYASQPRLPPATQDSVQNCWLGFVLATISGGTCSLSFQGATPISPGTIAGLPRQELLPHTGILRSRLETAQVLRYINGIGYSLTVRP